MTEEVWKDIPGFEGLYQVSNTGQVKSLSRTTRHTGKSGSVVIQPIRERILRATVNRRGYLSVGLRRAGRTDTREVHTLVASAFLGPRGEQDEQIRHVDGNRLNNHADNLRYGTRSQNQLDLYDYRGYHHKLRPDDVKDIRARLDRGELGKTLAKEYGVSNSTISAIKHREVYQWLM